jgi:hypothetical protein
MAGEVNWAIRTSLKQAFRKYCREIGDETFEDKTFVRGMFKTARRKVVS